MLRWAGRAHSTRACTREHMCAHVHSYMHAFTCVHALIHPGHLANEAELGRREGQLRARPGAGPRPEDARPLLPLQEWGRLGCWCARGPATAEPLLPRPAAPTHETHPHGLVPATLGDLSRHGPLLGPEPGQEAAGPPPRGGRLGRPVCPPLPPHSPCSPL